MGRVSRRSQNEMTVKKWWFNLLAALALAAAAYGVISLAIDSGNLLEYGLSIMLAGWAISRLVFGLRRAFER